MTLLVKRTGPSDMGLVQGKTYTVVEVRPRDGRLRLAEKDGEKTWTYWFDPSNFTPVDGEGT